MPKVRYIMDFTRLMIHTGMDMRDLHEIPKVALYNIIRLLEERLESCFLRREDREFIYYQIDCYNDLMLTAKK